MLFVALAAFAISFFVGLITLSADWLLGAGIAFVATWVLGFGTALLAEPEAACIDQGACVPTHSQRGQR